MGLFARLLGPGQPFKDGDVDLGVRSGPSSAYERSEKADLDNQLGPASATASLRAAETAVGLDQPGWASYYALAALMSGCPKTLGRAGFMHALDLFTDNYAKATGNMFPIATGQLLEWLVNAETGLMGYSPNGPATYFDQDPAYWQLVQEVATYFTRDADKLGATYDDAGLHKRIAEQVLRQGASGNG